MAASIKDVVEGHRDAITVKRVFGEPYEKNGLTVIPAAAVMGGGGGGEGEGTEGSQVGKGSGSGFGMAARPAGAYVVRGDNVRWQPAIDVNRIAAGVFTLVALALLTRRRRAK